MKFFNLDLHISVINDLRSIFQDLGHTIHSECLSNHTWVFNRPPGTNDVIGQHNWKQLTPALCDAFYERYKDELSHYDGFICCFPPCFSLLYEKFNKPIIIQIPIRYEAPFSSDPDKWNWLNTYLNKGVKEGRIFLCANSLYDKKYAESFLDVEVEYIPSLCLYTGTKYSPTKDKVLFLDPGNLKHDPLFNVTDILDVHVRSPYQWSDLYSYRGISHVPYNCSVMKYFEQYSANVPLFFPTQEYLVEMYQTWTEDHIMADLSWNKSANAQSKSFIPAKGPYDPNNYKDIDTLKHWIKFSDFYNPDVMPHIQYFNNIEEWRGLNSSFSFSDGLEVSEKMRLFNVTKKEKVYSQWDKVLNKIKELKMKPDFNRDSMEGQMTPEERQEIYRLVIDTKPDVVFEVGTWKGGGSTYFLSSALHENGKGVLFTIESEAEFFSHAVSLYSSTLKDLKPYVNFSFGNSEIIFPNLLKSLSLASNVDMVNKQFIDIVFLDGKEDPDQTLNELSMFSPYLKVGGIVACHDWKTSKTDKIRSILSGPQWELVSFLPNGPTGFAAFRKTK